jgi:DNA polymerase III epsilon subunit family exonuclease
MPLPGWARRLLPAVDAASPTKSGRPLSKVVFGVLDLETTGLSSTTNEILEIGLVVLRHGLNTRRFETLVRTDRTVPSVVEALTGIREADLLGAPPERQALDLLSDVLREEHVEVLVAHNARFDHSFLTVAWERHLLSPSLPPFLCTLRLARRLLRSPSYSLDVLAEQLGLLPRPRHRALGDAEVAADLFREILREAVRRGVTSLEDLESLQSSPRTSAAPREVTECGPERP